MVDFIRVGFDPQLVDYHDAWEMQRSVHRDVVDGNREDTVLLLEHTPVYTAGKRTDAAELPFDGAEFVETDRGGKITWHGPGQLVGYPIMRLPHPIDVVGYVRYLEQVLIECLAEIGIVALRSDGRTGVWVQTEDTLEKIAAIGIRVSEKTTMHGFAINCSNSLQPFENIVACGLSEVKATSITRLLGEEFHPIDFAERIERNLKEIPSGRP